MSERDDWAEINRLEAENARLTAERDALRRELDFERAKLSKCKDDLAKWVNHWRNKDPSDTLVELHDYKRCCAKMARDLIDGDKERDALRAKLATAFKDAESAAVDAVNACRQDGEADLRSVRHRVGHAIRGLKGGEDE